MAYIQENIVLIARYQPLRVGKAIDKALKNQA